LIPLIYWIYRFYNGVKNAVPSPGLSTRRRHRLSRREHRTAHRLLRRFRQTQWRTYFLTRRIAANWVGMQKHHIPAIEKSSGFEQSPWLPRVMWTKREHLQAEKYKIVTNFDLLEKSLHFP
jgi:hypothetical protein